MHFPLVLALWLTGCQTVQRTISEDDSPPPTVAMGMNLSSVSPYSSEVVFVDIYRQSGPWFPQKPGEPWGQGGKLDLAPEGHVRRLERLQTAEKIVFPDLDGRYPGGLYTCFYEGSGELGFGGGATIVQRAPNRIRVNVEPKKGPIAIRLLATNPQNPIRNIRLILDGFEDTATQQPFHPRFTQRLKGFQFIRFMDWMRTNGSQQQKWADRPKPTDDNWGMDKGVCLEVMIDLCNALKIDPWFCIPHQADDEYVQEFAKVVKSKLAPERKIYLEYSNEVWNTIFPQSGYCREKGLAAKTSDNDYEATLRYYSQRAIAVFQIFEKEMGGKDRLVRVLAAQGSNPWTGNTIMDWQDAFKSADAIAIAPYFGNDLGEPKAVEKTLKLSVNELLDACDESSKENAKFVQVYSREAKKRQLQLLAYEGGQHLVGFNGAENNIELEKLFQAANRHSRMREIYLNDLQRWKENGGGAYAVFASMGRYSKWGSWGLMEYFDQEPRTAPKYRAIREFIDMQKQEQ